MSSRFLFHFKTSAELYAIGNAIREGGMAANAFCIPSSLSAAFPDLQQKTIGGPGSCLGLECGKLIW